MVAVERRGEPHNGPHGEPCAHGPDQPRMLRQPRTDPTGRPGRPPAGIDPPPPGQPAGPPGKHIVRMHHELLVRELLLASLVKDSLKGLLAIPRGGGIDRRLRHPRPHGRGPCHQSRRRLARSSSIRGDGSRRRIKDLRRTPGKARLAPARSRQRARSLELRYVSLYRHGRH
jgi:hypothetical protein